jgi:putative nucleotidyltransferase with HDIG domain
MLEIAASRGFRATMGREHFLRLGDSHAGQAALQRRMVAIPRLDAHPEIRHQTSRLEGEDLVSYFAVPLIAKGIVKGVLEVFQRSEFHPNTEWVSFLETMAGQAAIAIDNANLFQGLQHSNQELAMAYDRTLEGWARALELRDNETEGHARRVTEMTLALARSFGVQGDALVHIRRGALLHDIGKMGIPDNILHKPGPLDEGEWALMHQHPVFAYEMLKSIDYLRPALDIPYAHHEKWDGGGYPRGLEKEQIPLAARIFAIVDVWDALNSDRPYRQAWPPEEVIAYIQECSGTHFDPAVVKAFLELIEEQY